MADNMLEIGARVDVSAIQSGMAAAANAVQTNAEKMAAALKAQGLSAEDAASALRNLGFAAKEAADASGLAAESTREVTLAENEEVSAIARTISARQAATASLSVLEGRLMGTNRAAAAFLSTTLGLGPALQLAFPVIGAIALFGVIEQVGTGIQKMRDYLASWDKEQEKIFNNSVANAVRLLNAYDNLIKRQAELAGVGLPPQADRFAPQVAALGKYQGAVAQVQASINDLVKSLDEAGKVTKETFEMPVVGEMPEVTGPVEEQISNLNLEQYQSKVDEQLDRFNAMVKAEAESKHLNIPPPITINWEASEKTVREQLAKIAETMRSEAEALSVKQAETTQRVGEVSAEGDERSRERAIKAWELYGKAAIGIDSEVAKAIEKNREEVSKRLEFQLDSQLKKEEQVSNDEVKAQQTYTKAILDSLKAEQENLNAAFRIDEMRLQQKLRLAEASGNPANVTAVLQQQLAVEQQFTTEAMALAERERDVKVAALESEMEAIEQVAAVDQANFAKYMAQWDELAAQITALDQEFETKKTAIAAKGAEDRQRILDKEANYERQIQNRISNEFVRISDQMLFHSKSFADAVNKLWVDLAQLVINRILTMGAQWITQHVLMAAYHKIFGTQIVAEEGTSKAAQGAEIATANSAHVISDAAVAASEAYAAYAYFPPLAEAMAAEAFAAVMAYMPLAAMASAAGGFDVPSDTVTMLHKREMVLPAPLADRVRGMTEPDGGSGETHYHVHLAQNVEAIDGESAARFYGRTKHDMQKEVFRAMRSGHLNPAKSL